MITAPDAALLRSTALTAERHRLARAMAGLMMTRYGQGGARGTQGGISVVSEDLTLGRHCEERSDAAIHTFFGGEMDCFAARNDD